MDLKYTYIEKTKSQLVAVAARGCGAPGDKGIFGARGLGDVWG